MISDAIWDNLRAPAGLTTDADLFEWVGNNYPKAEEHDFIIATDGSGCTEGWGAMCAIIETAYVGSKQVVMSATYGQTVQRCELQALLEGLYTASRIVAAHFGGTVKEAVESHAGQRFSVFWITDRSNLAKMLLTGEDDKPVCALRTDNDLTMRLRYLMRFFNITPMHMPRNQDEDQKMCDTVCGVMRTHMKQIMKPALAIIQGLPIEQCQKQPQSGLRF